MQRIVAIVLVLAFGVVLTAHGAERPRGYIYDEVSSAKPVASLNLAIVITVDTATVEVQDKAEARVGVKYGGLYGEYKDCGNEAFYCLTGPLEIVIPRAMPMKQWTYHGLFCQSVAQQGGDTYRISCGSHEYRGHPAYTYSLSRGVVSIESAPIWAADRFELRGDHGLFSSGSNP